MEFYGNYPLVDVATERTGLNHHFLWENSRHFDWAIFQFAILNYCRVYCTDPPAHFLYKITDCNPLSSRCRGTTLNPNFLYKIEVGGRKEKNKKTKKNKKNIILLGHDFLEAFFG